MDTLIHLENITREFSSGDRKIQVLKGINLDIQAGEMVAIVGSSGSGKSTLMNILGCLDKPTGGKYEIAGRATNELEPNELASLRREYFGFIFQRYHLLNALTAQGNVEIPAIYSGMDKSERLKKSEEVLTRLGLGDKIHNKPSQLSGGQQQRVSIGRALINGGQVILADEPTGALDQESGKEVMSILRELHQQGYTIIIVTHDMKIAESAERIVEICDGNIISDSKNTKFDQAVKPQETQPFNPTKAKENFYTQFDRFKEAFKMAILSMQANRLRTFLTMLGIIMGIASVVSVVALAKGTQEKVLDEINSIGTNTLEIYPGKGRGDPNAGKIRTLKIGDVTVLAKQTYVQSATPNIATSGYFRTNNKALTGAINGVGSQFFDVRGYVLKKGRFFNEIDIKNRTLNGVIDSYTAESLFKNEDPIGKVIHIGNLPVKIIGIATERKSGSRNSDSLSIWLPYSTIMSRMLGNVPLASISVRLEDHVDSIIAEKFVTDILEKRHGSKDFNIRNSDAIKKTTESVTSVMKLLISSIATISLIVGGIGVMNIMLVSVSERTREIGVRMAVGARTNDILQQFLIEAVLVCFVGGVIGILLSLGIGYLFNKADSLFKISFSIESIILAFTSSTLIGLIFGYFPAKRAAEMDPIQALERE